MHYHRRDVEQPAALHVVFGLVQPGLRRVHGNRKTHLETSQANVEASMRTPGPAVA